MIIIAWQSATKAARDNAKGGKGRPHFHRRPWLAISCWEMARAQSALAKIAIPEFLVPYINNC